MNALEVQLAAIREAFIAELPQRAQRIADAWQALSDTDWTLEATQTFHREVHSLSGAGATFGCNELSTRARALELKFKSIIQDHTPATEGEVAELQALYGELKDEMRLASG